MKLTPRLKKIADLIPIGARVGDVGSDHGYLAAYLVENGIASLMIASDINQGPVDNAISTLKECGLEDRVQVRLGGGLLPYDLQEIQVAVIAGMGGMLIRDIISERIEMARTLDFLVLQPMTQQPELRRWLIENGFDIFSEQNVHEGQKYYEVFCVRSGRSNLTDEIELEIGLNRDVEKMDTLELHEFELFLTHKIKKYHKIINEIGEKGSEESMDVLQNKNEKRMKIEEVLEHVRQWKKHKQTD